MRRLAAAVAAFGALGAPLVLPAAPASAHTTLESTDPASGAEVAPPSALTLTFADPVMVPQIVLSGAGGGRYEAGPARAVDSKVTQAVRGTLPNGVYTVGWRVVASDGHPVTGSYKFSVRGSNAASSAPSASARPTGATSEPAAGDEPDGSSGWLWVGLAAAVAVLVAGGVALARRR